MAASRAPEPSREHEHTFDDEVRVTVRRSPRYGRFALIGGGIGLIVTLVLTVGGAATGYLAAGASGLIRVVGVVGLVCVAAGVLGALLLALVLDRTLGRPHATEAGRETTVRDDLVSPVTDDPPRWLRDEPPGPMRRGPVRD